MTETKINNTFALWWLIPPKLRDRMKARTPYDVTFQNGTEGLLVQVGGPNPVRWLVMYPSETEDIHCELHVLTQKGTRAVGDRTVISDLVPKLIEHWIQKHNLT